MEARHIDINVFDEKFSDDYNKMVNSENEAEQMMAICVKQYIMDKGYIDEDILNFLFTNNFNDPEIVTLIYNFLEILSEDEEGIKWLELCQRASTRDGAIYFVKEIIQAFKNNYAFCDVEACYDVANSAFELKAGLNSEHAPKYLQSIQKSLEAISFMAEKMGMDNSEKEKLHDIYAENIEILKSKIAEKDETIFKLEEEVEKISKEKEEVLKEKEEALRIKAEEFEKVVNSRDFYIKRSEKFLSNLNEVRNEKNRLHSKNIALENELRKNEGKTVTSDTKSDTPPNGLEKDDFEKLVSQLIQQNEVLVNKINSISDGLIHIDDNISNTITTEFANLVNDVDGRLDRLSVGILNVHAKNEDSAEYINEVKRLRKQEQEESVFADDTEDKKDLVIDDKKNSDFSSDSLEDTPKKISEDTSSELYGEYVEPEIYENGEDSEEIDSKETKSHKKNVEFIIPDICPEGIVKSDEEAVAAGEELEPGINNKSVEKPSGEKISFFRGFFSSLSIRKQLKEFEKISDINEQMHIIMQTAATNKLAREKVAVIKDIFNNYSDNDIPLIMIYDAILNDKDLDEFRILREWQTVV